MDGLLGDLGEMSDAWGFSGHQEGGRDGAPEVRKVTVVVADAHAAIRDGLPLLLRHEGLEVVATAPTGDALEAALERYEPDVALIGLDLPDVDGIVLCSRLLRNGTRSALVLYLEGEDDQQVATAVHQGAAGVIDKTRPIAQLARALTTVANGGMWFGDNDRFDSGEYPAARRVEPGRVTSLSVSEKRVLAMLAEGGSTEGVSESLHVSPHTVRTHVKNIMRKLDAQSRAHAVAIAMRDQLIEV